MIKRMLHAVGMVATGLIVVMALPVLLHLVLVASVFSAALQG